MSSEFAKTLSAKLTADIPPHIVKWGEKVIDAELQAVREVVELIAHPKFKAGESGIQVLRHQVGR